MIYTPELDLVISSTLSFNCEALINHPMDWQKSLNVPKGMQYVLLSVSFWIGIEYITVWHDRVDEWISFMPWILIQYGFITLIFYYSLFRKEWSEKRVFTIMIVVMYIFEILWQNFLLADIFLFIPGSGILISIWGFLTFIPFWLLEHSIKEHKVQVIIYSLWSVGGFIFAIFL